MKKHPHRGDISLMLFHSLSKKSEPDVSDSVNVEEFDDYCHSDSDSGIVAIHNGRSWDTSVSKRGRVEMCDSEDGIMLSGVGNEYWIGSVRYGMFMPYMMVTRCELSKLHSAIAALDCDDT